MAESQDERVYDVQVDFNTVQQPRRLWAIPMIGFTLKSIFLLPHMLFVYGYLFASGAAFWVTWIPVLLTGSYPTWAYDLVGGTLKKVAMLNAFLFGIIDQYPSFFGENDAVNVTFRSLEKHQRLPAVPVIGFLAKLLYLIPHLILLYLLLLVVYLLQLVSWTPVLFAGRPPWGTTQQCGYLR